MHSDEHVIRLDSSTNEETGQWYDWQTQTSRQVRISKSLWHVSSFVTKWVRELTLE